MGFIIGGTYTPPLASIIGVYGTNMKQVHINVDSSNNIYMNAMTGFDNRIIKLNSSGTAQWQAGKQDDMAGTLENSNVTSGVDSSGNYYFAANAYGAGVDRVGSLNLFKYDSNGSIVWQKYIRGASNTSISNIGFYIDSSDNLYVIGTMSNSMVLFKLNSSGTVQWGKKYAVTGIVASGSLTVDSSGNVYGSGYITASGQNRPFGFKTNSSGVLQWMTSVGDGATNIYSGPPSSTVVDSSGNLYIGINFPAPHKIIKFNSSGVVQWQRAGTAGSYLGIDSSGNIYSAGTTTDSPTRISIFKHDSAGSLQWQRTISHASTAMTVGDIAVNSSGINIAGITSASGSNRVFFARLSLDGASTGTYAVGGYNYVYEASSISSSTPALTSSTISVTETTDAGSVGTPSGYTLQTPSLSTSVTTISSAGASGPFGAIMGGTGLGMVISSYVAPPPTPQAWSVSTTDPIIAWNNATKPTTHMFFAIPANSAADITTDWEYANDPWTNWGAFSSAGMYVAVPGGVVFNGTTYNGYYRAREWTKGNPTYRQRITTTAFGIKQTSSEANALNNALLPSAYQNSTI